MQILKILPKETIPIIQSLSSKKMEESLVGLQNNMQNYALMLTANKDSARDLCQETILKALANFDKYYDNVNFKGWVFTIMHNIFVNNYRQALRQKTILDHTDNLLLLNLPQNSAFNNAESDYAYAEIIKAIHSLDEQYKTPFSMHFSGYRYLEIAEIMELPVGTVKSRIFFARKRLQEILIDYK